jgi:type I restriction-modification system DNA methylase subunit
MPASETIRRLVARFEEHREAYRLSKYNETQLRREFLDPFFEELGWDVLNKQGYAEAYKEVIHEDSLEVEGATKAPDYAFRIGGQRKFFVEAKKPSVNIQSDIYPAFQLRRYSWSAKLPLGILSDFEELAVYDCRIKPDKKDKASTGRVTYYSFRDYVEKWDEIASIFSREAVLKGSFDKFAEGVKGKKGTAEVDDAFLAEIEHWREVLARNFALRNPSLNTRELNYAVQMTIDRIIFLRICEDRGIERYEKLKDVSEQDNVYAGLCQVFKQADARYNSGLFHFKDEKDASSAADSLTLSLSLDNKVLREILESLYYPESPYVFSEIPADILGQVYERFLGKVIRLTAGHQAKVEEKPEVRKAGGVYYTPTYIVEYIVKNTVGKLLEGKTPREVSPLKILDPACGSGTFPLGVYQYLLDWHLKWYVENDPEKHAKGKSSAVFQSDRGWLLTTAEKKRILLNNIYGVDIDLQAVEVTKLSLLLKVLENESEQTIGSQLSLIQERALPDLGRNIKCGNSLIGPDFYDGHQLIMGFADEDEQYRVNAFDWKAEFPQVFIQGGFDVVLGNPPYGANFDKGSEAYIRNKFSAVTNSLDSFIMFVEQAGSLLNSHGYFGMIIPSGWVSTPSSKKLRERFAEQFRPTSFVSLPYDIFDGAYIDTIIVTAQRLASGKVWMNLEDTMVDLIVFPIRRKIESQKDFDAFRISGSFADWIEAPDKGFLVLSSKEQASLVKKLRENPAKFDSVVEVKRGIEIYHPRPAEECQNPKRAFNGEMLRYRLDIGPEAYEGYPPDIEAGKPMKFFHGQRILLRQLISRKFRLQAVYSDEEFLTNQSVQSLILRNMTPNIKCILGILNSRLLSWFFCQINMVARRDDFPKIIIKQTRELPFPKIDFNNPTDKERHDKVASLVDRMLELHKQHPRTPQDKERLQREIESTDRAIDRLVYELYGLTEDEIRVVEG